MAAPPKWTEEEKVKALSLAEVSTVRDAARETGIPEGTIKRWRSETNRTEGNEPNRTNKKVKAVAQQAHQEAVEEAKEYILDRIKSLADELYSLAEEGVKETRNVIKNTKPFNKDRDSAAWLRSVVGAMHYGIQDAQLLSGKPTTRPEVTNRHEYDITQRIIADPEALNLADQLLQRAANSDTGMVRTHRKPWDVVSVRPPVNSEPEDS